MLKIYFDIFTKKEIKQRKNEMTQICCWEFPNSK